MRMDTSYVHKADKESIFELGEMKQTEGFYKIGKVNKRQAIAGRQLLGSNQNMLLYIIKTSSTIRMSCQECIENEMGM